MLSAVIDGHTTTSIIRVLGTVMQAGCRGGGQYRAMCGKPAICKSIHFLSLHTLVERKYSLRLHVRTHMIFLPFLGIVENNFKRLLLEANKAFRSSFDREHTLCV